MSRYPSPQDDFEKMIEHYKSELLRCRRSAGAQPKRTPPAPSPAELTLPTDRIAPAEPAIPWAPAVTGGVAARGDGGCAGPPADTPAAESEPPAPREGAGDLDGYEPRCHAFPPFTTITADPAPADGSLAYHPDSSPYIDVVPAPEPPAEAEPPEPPAEAELPDPPADAEPPDPPADAEPPEPPADAGPSEPPAGAGPSEPPAGAGPNAGARSSPRGMLTVRATTGRGASPVEGAHVTVSRQADGGGETLLAIAETDRDGATRLFALQARPAAQSLSPAHAQPGAAYHIRVDKPGFFPFHARGVPVYEGVTAIQTAELVPLPEDGAYGRSEESEEIVETGPQDL